MFYSTPPSPRQVCRRAHTPTPKDKPAKDVSRALASPDLREQLIKLGGEPMSMTPDDFSKFVRSEIEASARIVKEAWIKPQ